MERDISLFYNFGSKLSGSCFQAAPTFDHKFELSTKDLITGKYEKFRFPITFHQDSGFKMYDLLDTGYQSLYLISEKLKSVLVKNDFTGWKTYPITLQNSKGGLLEGYCGFSVIGTCGKIDYAKSKIIEKSTVTGGPISKYYLGEFIGLDKWDGSDFFIPAEHHRIKCTKNVKEILTKEKITHLRFENLCEIETWEKALKGKI